MAFKLMLPVGLLLQSVRKPEMSSAYCLWWFVPHWEEEAGAAGGHPISIMKNTHP